MKKIIAIIAFALSTSACAHGQHRGHGHWVAPAVIGAVVGAVIAAPVYTPPRQVHVQPYYYPYPPQPQVTWRSVDVYIPECNCVRTVRVPTY